MVKFLKTALKNYSTVGAITEISRYVADRVVREMGVSPRVVIEYGAGSGALTKRILPALAENGRLIAVELLPEFVAELQNIRDARLTVVHGDIEDVLSHYGSLGVPQADVAVSNIPFSLMDGGKRLRILSQTRKILRPGGLFIIYQNLPVVVSQMRRFFSHISWQLEVRNFPPYFVLTGVNPGAGDVTRNL